MYILMIALIITLLSYSIAYFLSSRAIRLHLEKFSLIFIFFCIWSYLFCADQEYHWQILGLWLIFIALSFVGPLVAYLVTAPLVLPHIIREVMFYTSLPLCILFVPWITDNTSIKTLILLAFMCLTAGFLLMALIVLAYYYSSHAKLSTDSIIAILQTHRKEAKDFLTSYFSPANYCVFIILYCGIFTAIYIFLSEIFAARATTGSIIIISLFEILLCLSCGIFFTKIEARKIIKNAIKIYKELKIFARNRNFRENKLQQCDRLKNDGENYNFALIIGESQTRTHMSAYGYNRDTTPWLRELKANGEAIIISNSFSCAAQTQQALELALTEKSQYNEIPLVDSMTIMEMARYAGYRTVWMSLHHNDTIVGMIGDEADEALWLNKNSNEAYMWQRDVIFDNTIVNKLATMKKTQEKTLYVIQLLGSHHSYDSKYPKEFNVWEEKENKTNAYDNSILYNDYIVSELHKVLFGELGVDGMIYFADHGDEIQKFFEHGTDFFLNNYKKQASVSEVVKIPIYMCFSKKYRENNPETMKNLYRNFEKYFSNDMIYDTLLGIMDIKGEHYNPAQDITAAGYNFDENTLKTIHGKVNIREVI